MKPETVSSRNHILLQATLKCTSSSTGASASHAKLEESDAGPRLKCVYTKGMTHTEGKKFSAHPLIYIRPGGVGWGRAGQGGAGQGRAGQGRARRGRVGQVRAGQGSTVMN